MTSTSPRVPRSAAARSPACSPPAPCSPPERASPPTGPRPPRRPRSPAATLARRRRQRVRPVALRLQAGVPTTLQVDAGDDGTRRRQLRPGDLRPDRRERPRRRRHRPDRRRQRHLHRHRDHHDLRRRRRRHARSAAAAPSSSSAGPGDDVVDGNRGNDTALMGSGARRLHLGPRRRQRRHRGPGRLRHHGLQRLRRRRELRRLGERAAAAVLPRRRQHHHGHRTAWRRSTSTRSAGWTPPRSTTSRGTDVKKVYVDLAARDRRDRRRRRRRLGDRQRDAGRRRDRHPAAQAAGPSWSGLAAKVAVAHPEAANDSLTVNALGGEDEIHLGAGLSA